eukprot:CAMPEP_0182905584 /NCGR_PEP_ID=MMETSP0034_2-20130328/33053_1 /TAXON_ID=156128 /ORGANISM="Nephroselmis pyriformis, Strain CCMP717" /LENGTH=170 /DNA_ID=CAMNT_0025041031 /DNA_START=105 /DNA_END=615 /DNA_ORIENTATION=-
MRVNAAPKSSSILPCPAWRAPSPMGDRGDLPRQANERVLVCHPIPRMPEERAVPPPHLHLHRRDHLWGDGPEDVREVLHLLLVDADGELPVGDEVVEWLVNVRLDYHWDAPMRHHLGRADPPPTPRGREAEQDDLKSLTVVSERWTTLKPSSSLRVFQISCRTPILYRKS